MATSQPIATLETSAACEMNAAQEMIEPHATVAAQVTSAMIAAQGTNADEVKIVGSA